MEKGALQSAGVSLVVAALTASCSLSNPVPSRSAFAVDPAPYVTRVKEMTVPTDEAARRDLCNNLRQDRARMVSGIRAPSHIQEAAAAVSPPDDVGAALGSLGESVGNIGIESDNRRLRQNIAAIDQKMAEAACDLPHMPAASSKRAGPELEQCVATCQKVTARDAPACFKDCAQ
jgi:hypothetical protein